MSPWIPVAIALFGTFFGLIVHALVIGRLVGSWATTQKSHGEHLTKIDQRLEGIDTRITGVEDEVSDEASRRSGFEQRLGQVEDAAKVFWDVRDKLTAMTSANEVHETYRREKMDKLERSVGEMQRSLGTLAAKGLDFRNK